MFSISSYFSRNFQIIWINLDLSNDCYDQVCCNSCHDEAGCNSCYDKAGLDNCYNKAGHSSYYDEAGRIGILLRILPLGALLYTKSLRYDKHKNSKLRFFFVHTLYSTLYYIPLCFIINPVLYSTLYCWWCCSGQAINLSSISINITISYHRKGKSMRK